MFTSPKLINAYIHDEDRLLLVLRVLVHGFLFNCLIQFTFPCCGLIWSEKLGDHCGYVWIALPRSRVISWLLQTFPDLVSTEHSCHGYIWCHYHGYLHVISLDISMNFSHWIVTDSSTRCVIKWRIGRTVELVCHYRLPYSYIMERTSVACKRERSCHETESDLVMKERARLSCLMAYCFL